MIYTELIVRMPVPDLVEDTKEYAGKVDYFDDQSGLLVDYKFTSNIDGFLNGLVASHQLQLYALALINSGKVVTGAEYRLVQRPSLRPSAADKDGAGVINYDMFENRCYAWLKEDPSRLRPYECMVSEEAQATALAWLFLVMKQMNHAPDYGVTTNPAACFSYSSVCQFSPLCKARMDGVDADSMGKLLFNPRRQRHIELTLEENDCITNSELETFVNCQQKWYCKYVLGLTPKDEAVSESLTVGRLCHEAVDLMQIHGSLIPALRHIDAWRETSSYLPGGKGPEQASTISAKCRAMVRSVKDRWFPEQAY